VKSGEKHPVTQIVVDKDVKPVVVKYGKFINAIIALVIQGFAVFMVVKAINKLKKAPAATEPPPPPADVQLLTEIRDLLKKQA
jgi:large conductance mechanosensitive channel